MKVKQDRINNDNIYNVVLIRSSDIGTTAFYLERALNFFVNCYSIVVPDYFAYSLLYRALIKAKLKNIASKVIEIDVNFYISQYLAKKNIDPDLVIVVDPIRIPPPRGPWRTVYYAIDSHIARYEHITEARAHDYDLVFVAQRDYVSFYRAHGCKKVYWLPLAFDPLFHREHKNVNIVYEVVFVGKTYIGDRPLYLREIKKRFPNSYMGTAWLHNMARKYSQGKIGFNKSLAGDLNMRVFEVLGCRRLLVTDCIRNGLAETFHVNNELVCYKDLRESLELIEYYLEASEEREIIARKGFEKAISQHTYLHRAYDMLKTAGLAVSWDEKLFKSYRTNAD